MALKLPNLCPLVLLVKVTWRQGRALENEEGKMVGSGLIMHQRKEVGCLGRVLLNCDKDGRDLQ